MDVTRCYLVLEGRGSGKPLQTSIRSADTRVKPTWHFRPQNMNKAHITAMCHTIFSAECSATVPKKLINPKLGETQLGVKN